MGSQDAPVSITHFITPHLFWYTRDINRNHELVLISKLEHDLSDYYSGPGKNQDFVSYRRLELGELLATYFLPWTKFIRVRVLTISKNIEDAEEFIVWAVDYGFPFRSKLKNMRHLPDIRFKEDIASVLCGGVAHIQPGEMEYDFKTREWVMSPITEWSDHACRQVAKLINSAAHISFRPYLFQSSTKYYRGTLLISKYNQIFDVSSYLKALSCAIVIDMDCEHWYTKLSTTQLSWNMSNKGEVKLCKVDYCSNCKRYEKVEFDVQQSGKRLISLSLLFVGKSDSEGTRQQLDRVSADTPFTKYETTSHITEDESINEEPGLNLISRTSEKRRDVSLSILADFDPLFSSTIRHDVKDKSICLKGTNELKIDGKLPCLSSQISEILPDVSLNSILAEFDPFFQNKLRWDVTKNESISRNENELRLDMQTSELANRNPLVKGSTTRDSDIDKSISRKKNKKLKIDVDIFKIPKYSKDYHLYGAIQLDENQKSMSVVDETMSKTLKQSIDQSNHTATLWAETIKHDQLLLAHSKVPLNILQQFEDATLMPDIMKEMIRIGFNKLNLYEAYGWPHLLRGNALFIVSSPRMGKTWAYLPVICSSVLRQFSMNEFPNDIGPMAIILAPTAAHCKEIAIYCNELLVHTEVTVVACIGKRNMKEVHVELTQPCGILIITPSNLQTLFERQRSLQNNAVFFSPNRIKHFIIDDMHLMLSRMKDSFEKSVEVVLNLFRHCGTSTLQLIVTSRSWHYRFVTLFDVANEPLFLSDSFLEVFAYSRSHFSIKMCSHSDEFKRLLDFLCTVPENCRILIFCNDDNADKLTDKLNQWLHVTRIYAIACTANSKGKTLIDSWKQKNSGFIAVCSDKTFPLLKIQNAHCIIHYYMPRSWVTFSKRFSALFDNFNNLVANDFQKNPLSLVGNNQSKVTTCILLNKNSRHLAKLYEFLRRHDLLKRNEENTERLLLSWARNQIRQLPRSVPLCPNVLEFGNCEGWYCEYRHTVINGDISNGDIPQSGYVQILVLAVFSPVHFSARLLKHSPVEGSKWHTVRRSDEASEFAMKLNSHYNVERNCVAYWPLEPNALCVCKAEKSFERVRIINALVKDFKTTKVEVKLIDVGVTKFVWANNLMVCENTFKNFPPQAIDIRLSDIVPYDNERQWDVEAWHTIKNWVTDHSQRGANIQLCVDFALAETIWTTTLNFETPTRKLLADLRTFIVYQRLGKEKDNTGDGTLINMLKLKCTSAAKQK